MTIEELEKQFYDETDVDVEQYTQEGKENKDIDEYEEGVRLAVQDQSDVIYYQTAMEYLMEHDDSLHQSTELAQDMGYETKDINSELLASLLSQEKNMITWQDMYEEFEECLNN